MNNNIKENPKKLYSPSPNLPFPFSMSIKLDIGGYHGKVLRERESVSAQVSGGKEGRGKTGMKLRDNESITTEQKTHVEVSK